MLIRLTGVRGGIVSGPVRDQRSSSPLVLIVSISSEQGVNFPNLSQGVSSIMYRFSVYD